MVRHAVNEESRHQSLEALWKIVEPRIEQSLHTWLRFVAERSTVEPEDFMVDAYLLCEYVADRFDKTRGLKFWTYYSRAWTRHANAIAKEYAKSYIEPKPDEAMSAIPAEVADVMAIETLVDALVPATVRNRDLKILMWKYYRLDEWTLQELSDGYGPPKTTIRTWIIEIGAELAKAIAISKRDSKI